MRQRAAVLGSPIAHSLSPALHGAAYRVLGIDWDYSAVECDVDSFPSFFGDLGPEWMGLSLTMPLKEVVLEHVEQVDPVALEVGAANTVYRAGAQPGGDWTATNTDIVGIVRAVRSAGARSLESAELLGAGATARSAVVALARLGVTRVRVSARRAAPADQVATFADGLGMQASAADLSVSTSSPTTDADIVISTLPADAAGVWADMGARPDTALLDTSYHPWPSVLAMAWMQRRPHAPVASGRDMLLWQAVAQVGLMTGAYASDDQDDPAAQEVAKAMGTVIHSP